ADLAGLGERSVLIDCDVLQADGGTLTAAVTGGYVALALALERLRAAGVVAALPLTGTVAGVSAGIVDGRQLLDLAYEEDHRAEVDLNVVVTGAGRLVEVQGTAEGKPFTLAQLERLLDLPPRASGRSPRCSGRRWRRPAWRFLAGHDPRPADR